MNRHSPSAIKAFKELQTHRQRSLKMLIDRVRHAKQRNRKVAAG